MKPLDNTDIDSFFKCNPLYGGCFSKDEIGYINGGVKKFYVLNMDKESGEGTHWVLLSMMDPNTGIYFDSFSVAPPNIVEIFLKRNRGNNVYNNGIIQQISSVNCGYYCIKMGLDLSNGVHFLDALDEYSSDEKDNERVITEWWKGYMKH